MRALTLVALLALPAAAQTDDALPQGQRPRPPAGARPEKGEATPGGRDYDVVLKNGSPFLELELGGAKGLFLLDTGANVSGVDEEWLEEQKATFRPGKASTVGGTTGSVKVESGVFDRLELGTGYFVDAVLKLQSFSHFRAPAPGRPQVGLLGTDFLNRYQVTVDFVASKATLALRHERQPLPADHEPVAVGYPLHPTVGIRLGGVHLPCRVDTGASTLGERAYLDVNPAAVALLRRAGVALKQVGTMTLAGVSGSTKRPLLVLAGDDPEDGVGGLVLALGPVEVSDVTLIVHETGTLAIDAPQTLAGGSILRRTGRFVLDPFDHLMWVPRPPKRQGPRSGPH